MYFLLANSLILFSFSRSYFNDRIFSRFFSSQSHNVVVGPPSSLFRFWIGQIYHLGQIGFLFFSFGRLERGVRKTKVFDFFEIFWNVWFVENVFKFRFRNFERNYLIYNSMKWAKKIRHNRFHHLVSFFIMRERLVFLKMRNDLTATWSVALLCLCVYVLQ